MADPPRSIKIVAWADPADIAEGMRLGRGRGEGEAAVLAGEFVRPVDPAVAGIAEGGLVGATERRGRLLAAHVAQYLHRAALRGRGGGVSQSRGLPPAISAVFWKHRNEEEGFC